MLTNSKKKLWVALAACYFTVGEAAAEDPVDRGNIFVSASYGYQFFDNKRTLEDRSYGGVALGLSFTTSWSASLFYSRMKAELSSGERHRFENYYLQGKHYFMASNPVRPYVVAGVGETFLAEGNITSDATIHSGVGVHWVVNPKVAFQVDYRYFYSFNGEFNDQSTMASLVYRFAEGER